MANTLNVYLDDSGQLNDHYGCNYFIYGGFYCFNDEISSINKSYRRLKRNIFRTKLEVKSSEMKNSQKRKLLRRILRDNPNSFHPVYCVARVDELTRVDYRNPKAVILHKNYILRRLLEKIIEKIRFEGVVVENVNLFIDNQTITDLQNRDSLPNYLKKSFKNGYKTQLSKMTSNAKFKSQYTESSNHCEIQIADLLANTKFCHYRDETTILKEIFEECNVILWRDPY